MKIAWFCIPAFGHTNPTLGVVKEMTDAGHEIYYFSFDKFREEIENAGAIYISCDGQGFDTEEKAAGDRAGKDLSFATELMVKSTLSLDEMVSEKIKELKPDMVVSDSVAYWGKLIAMKYGIPYVSSTTTFAYNQYSSKYLQQGIREKIGLVFAMPRINRNLQLLRDNGYPVKSILDIISNDNMTNTIVYTSKEFQPCSETFSEKYCFIGPSIRPVTDKIEKTAEKTIYISMGTVVQNAEVFKSCIKALGNTGYQVIISLGETRLKQDVIPSNIQLYDSVDQMAVLSIADAFLTHCGMNSASEALYYEVPLVMLPQTPEEGAVARRVEELGAGIMLGKTDEATIKDAFRKVLSDTRYRENAVKISNGFKKCGGSKAAKEYLEKMFAPLLRCDFDIQMYLQNNLGQ